MVDIDISALSLGTRISGKTSQNNLLQFKKSIIVCDQRVEISLIEYFDKVFVIVTSIGRLGAIVNIKPEKVGNEIIYSIKNSFGEEEPILQVFGRSLAQNLARHFNITKPLTLGIGLQKQLFANIDFFKTCEKAILHFTPLRRAEN